MFYWDQSLKGFGVRVSVGGAKSWVIMSGRDRRLTTLGRYPATTLKDARIAAKLALAQPADLTPSLTTQEALEAFFSVTEKRTRPKTIYEYRRCLNRHLAPILRRQLRDVNTDTIMRIVDKLHDTPIEQLHTFNISQTFFRFCARRRFISRSPLEYVPLPGKFNRRDRVLDEQELKTVWNAAEAEPYPFGPIIQLCILTGQRRGEIGKLRWEYIDLEQRTITLPKHITKNGLTHVFPFCDEAKAVLDALPKTEGYLFPGRVYRRSLANDAQRHFEGWSRGKVNFDKHCLVTDWTLHDLRRTFRTMHAKIGTPPHIAERLVNHVGSTSVVEKIYDRYTYMPEMKAAVETYEAHLAALFAQKITSAKAA